MSDNVVPLRAKSKTAQELLAELAADPKIKGVLVVVHHIDDSADVVWSEMATKDLTYLGACAEIEIVGSIRGHR